MHHVLAQLNLLSTPLSRLQILELRQRVPPNMVGFRKFRELKKKRAKNRQETVE